MQIAERHEPARAAQRALVTQPLTCLVASCETWSSTTMLPALLAQSGLTVTSLSPSPFNLSRYVTTKFRCSREPERAAKQVRELLVRHRYDWVIVGDEGLLRALAAGRREDLRDWFPVDPERDDLIALLTSKHAFAELAPMFGIPIPESALLSSVEECVAQARLLRFPVVAKGPYGFSGLEVFVAHDEAQLRAASERLLERYPRVLLQRFVEGELASAAVLYDRGEPSAYKAYITECPFPRAHSAATVHRPFEHPELETIVRAAGAATGFHGMAGIDFVHESATGSLYALEINPRPTSAFAGLREDRAFFGPAVVRFVHGSREPAVRYEGDGRAQAYFPSYAFYFLGHAKKSERESYRRLAASLAQGREPGKRIALWEFARFVARAGYDRIGARSPRLRAWVEARRRSQSSG